MNYKRILMGGLLAGLIINASEFLLNGVVLADEMQADMARLGLHYASWAMPAFVIMAFVYGLSLAWLYASLRPRFGPGPRTALLATGVVWVLAYLIPTVMYLAMGAGSQGTYALAVVWGLVELLIAGQLAGYLYQEGRVV